MHPDFYWAHRFLGLALELKGATGEAIAEYRKAFELYDDPVVLALLAHAEVSIGKQNEARQILAQLTEEAKTRYVPAYAFAVIHLALGEKDQALDWLEKAARGHDGLFINLIKVDPYLDPLRGDPRFEALVAKVARRPFHARAREGAVCSNGEYALHKGQFASARLRHELTY
jgi:serine/threonine-protein kinase